MLSRSRHVFFGISALLFAASAAMTVRWSASMSERGMAGMTMPGGAATRMPGQDGSGAAAFLAMWMVMMAAMMLPSLAPALWRYRQAIGSVTQVHGDRLTLLASGGYFFVWLLFGTAVFPFGPTIAAIERQWPQVTQAIPIAVAALVVAAGLLQFTRWKAYHLTCCRQDHGRMPADAVGAWRHGLRLGLHCSFSSLGPTAILLAVGMMDLRAMAMATAAITAERLAADGERVARLVGVILVVAGLVLLVRAAG